MTLKRWLHGSERIIMGSVNTTFGKIMRYYVGRLLSDKLFITYDYWRVFRKRPNLKQPGSYSEKLQWLKLYDRNPLYKTLADKLSARQYISDEFGCEYLFPVIGVYESFDQIDFALLPDEFVLKPNHASGEIFICTDKATINHRKLKKEIDGWLKRDYYYAHREWQYKGIERRIICEKLMIDEITGVPWNYKFFCFNGKPEFLVITTGQGRDRPQNYYDMNLNPINVWNSKRSISNLQKPDKYDEMVDLVCRIVKHFVHIRMDMYLISGQIYIGEFTLYNLSGLKRWEPNEFDYELGRMLDLKEWLH